VITKKGKYGEETIHRCTDLNSAMDLFKFLVQSNTVEIEEMSAPDNTEEPDEDGYVPNEYIKYEKGEADYHIGTEIIDVYTEKEATKLSTEREAWIKPFRDKAAKLKKKGSKK